VEEAFLILGRQWDHLWILKVEMREEEKIGMKKSKITKEEWDNKQDLIDILNKYDINFYDFMNYLIEFELPELDLNYKVKEEDCRELI